MFDVETSRVEEAFQGLDLSESYDDGLHSITSLSPNSAGIQVPLLREPSLHPRHRLFAPAQLLHPSRSHRGRGCLPC